MRLETGGLIIGGLAVIGSVLMAGFAIFVFWYCAQDVVMVNGTNLQYDNGQVQIMSKINFSISNGTIKCSI